MMACAIFYEKGLHLSRFYDKIATNKATLHLKCVEEE